MADAATIQDYSFIDNFLSESLNNYNKQLFGDYDENTGYFEELNDDQEENQVQNSEDDVSDDASVPLQPSEEDLYNSVFSGEENISSGGGGGGGLMKGISGVGNSGFKTFGSYEQGKAALINQLKLYQTGKSRNATGRETLEQIMGIYAPSADKNNPKAYAAFVAKKMGVSVNTPISQFSQRDIENWAGAIEQMEGNKSGNNPGNIRKQTGGGIPNPGLLEGGEEGIQDALRYSPNLKFHKSGKFKGRIPADAFNDDILNYIDKFKDVKRKGERFFKVRGSLNRYGVAQTPQEQYEGLNNEALDNLILPLEGTNTIRGLDSSEPVTVQDEFGNSKVLYGPKDTTRMKGRVYEKKL